MARTDGVPLFVEELTKAVLEAGLLRTGDRYALPAAAAAAIPLARDSLMARLDRLAPVKEVAQVGGLIGREFALRAARGGGAAARGRAAATPWTSWSRAELVFRRGEPPEATYTFKHALVRDAAYESLLKSRRQQLHARIAEALEERFPETARREPELLAHHCTEAGLAEQAVDYWRRAGALALARSATLEAVAQLSRGLELLPGLPDGPSVGGASRACSSRSAAR